MSDTETNLPKATVERFLKEILPDDLKMDPDAVKLFNQMCVEFVCLLTSEANELMEKSKRKTIMAEHMQEALKGLGFGDYVVEAAEAVRVALGLSKDRNMKRQNWKKIVAATGLTEAQLAEEQKELIAQSKKSQA